MQNKLINLEELEWHLRRVEETLQDLESIERTLVINLVQSRIKNNQTRQEQLDLATDLMQNMNVKGLVNKVHKDMDDEQI